ncbi:MAG: nucleotide sugar dehydrogenase [Turicibacter sp.]
MKIAVVGIGYVGLSNAILLAQHNEVIALDIDKEKVNMINNKKSPIVDSEIEEYLATKDLNLIATTDECKAYSQAEYIIISTPTDYNVEKDSFDTHTIDNIIKKVSSINSEAVVIIKSTVPIGYTAQISESFGKDNIIFSPEFLREGKALYDNLYPSRIIIGQKSEHAKIFANLLLQGAIKKDVPILYTNSSEAEAIKLFSNTYLALRVAYFNELDTYAELHNLNSKQIIEGVCLDPRIGANYNNPSFGYGGYCLPKDTQQLRANYKNVPNKLISAIVTANQIRKEHITNMILKQEPKVVGIYRLTMKNKSDNFRASSVLDIIQSLVDKNIKVIIYEPKLDQQSILNSPIISNLDQFKQMSNIIVANRFSDELNDVKEKVYTRDIFNRD